MIYAPFIWLGIFQHVLASHWRMVIALAALIAAGAILRHIVAEWRKVRNV